MRVHPLWAETYGSPFLTMDDEIIEDHEHIRRMYVDGPFRSLFPVTFSQLHDQFDALYENWKFMR